MSIAWLSVCILYLGMATAVAAQHEPIVIRGDDQFTATNGVVNPDAAGTAADPFVVRDWSIDAGGAGMCIKVSDTTQFFELRNIDCRHASTGMRFENVSNGKILNSSISWIRGSSKGSRGGAGTALDFGACRHMTVQGNTVTYVFGGMPSDAGRHGGPGWGLRLAFSDNIVISNNRFMSLFGAAGSAARIGRAGGDGGSASGVFGVLSTRLVIAQNVFDTVGGGASGAGGAGKGVTGGGPSGGGGDASGVMLLGSHGVIATGNVILNLNGGFAGPAGDAAPDHLVHGGNGGRGGNTFGLLWFAVNQLSSRANTVQRLFAAPGAAGGAGGGRGGDGGEAAGQYVDGSRDSVTQLNQFDTIRGGVGGSGGAVNGGDLAAGGRGGHGVGLHYVGATGWAQFGNAVSGNDGGTAGPPGGQAGSAVPVLIE